MRKITTMRLDTELMARLTDIADLKNISRTHLVENILVEFVRREFVANNKPAGAVRRLRKWPPRPRPDLNDEQIRSEIFE